MTQVSYGSVESGNRREQIETTPPSSSSNSTSSRYFAVVLLSLVGTAVLLSRTGTSSYFSFTALESTDESGSSTDESASTSSGDPIFNDPSDPNSPSEPTITVSPTGLTFKLSRVGYSPIIIDDTILKYKFLADVDTVLEPYSATNVFVTDATSAEYYKFSICSLDSGECTEGSMSTDNSYTSDVTIGCTPFTIYTISVQEYNVANGIMNRQSTGTAMCMYVRREIRSLSGSDLSKLMDAMYTMWSVSEDDGVELYGDDYHDAKYLLRFHHFHAAWQDAGTLFCLP